MYLSVIQEPDKKGLNCNFQFNGLYMGGMKVGGFGLPHHPDYTIGPIDGSPCDTLGLDEYPPIVYSTSSLQASPVFEVYPNPANDNITITGKENIRFVRLYSALGQEVLYAQPEDEFTLQQNISVAGLESGIYFLEVAWDGGMYRSKIQVE
jgi:hypothetical protein